MTSRLLAAALAALLLSPVAADAGTLNLTGDTTTGPTFNRPTETGALSLYENVRYQAFQFSVTQDGPYTFTLAATDPSGFDTFLHLYRGGFDPAAPDNAFFLAANDDLSTANPDLGSGLNAIPLLTSGTYFLVLDGFSNLDFGAFTATVTGPGNITASAVPEPAAAHLILAAGVVGLAACVARRRHRSAVSGRR